jgi:outer membrane receptor protein involved in Fe transport
VNIPWRGWILDADMFRTNASNFFDHNNIGESNLFFPLTIQRALIRGWELTGSGLTNAFRGQPYPGTYVPRHTTFDLTLGKDFGERFSASVNAMNLANRRVELDNSITFGGFHWNNPREVYVEIRYRFHY